MAYKTDTRALYTKVFLCSTGKVVTFYGFNHVKRSRDYLKGLR